MKFDTSEECDQKETPIKQSYFIVTEPRTGSTLLARALAKQGLGIPLEYYNFMANRTIPAFCLRILGLTKEDERNVPFIEYTQELKRRRTTPNGVFGCKIFSNHHRRTFKKDFTLEKQLFPNHKYIWLKRKDIIAKSISYYFAVQTQQWNSDQKAKRAPDEVEYNFEKILTIFRLLKKDAVYWADFFQEHSDLDILTLYYSDLVNDYESTIRTVNHFLGFEDLEIPPKSISKQESPLKAEFKERFIQDVRKNKITS